MTLHSGRTLAYLGDAVFELLVREHLLALGIAQAESLHQHAVLFTSAEGQARCLESIKEVLTEEERTVIKRGRNGELSRKPRNADLHIYRTATGLEALFGHLHLNGDKVRLKTLFDKMTKSLLSG